MPIPSPEKGEKADDFLPRCKKAISDEYPSEQALAICYEKIKNRNMSEEKEEIFVLTPKKAENRGAYISRCSAHTKMKAQYPNMKERLGSCMNAFNAYYKYWSRLEEFGSEEHPDVKFEGCMSKQKASGKDYKESYSLCMGELIVEPVAMEEDTNIGDCVAKRIKEDPSLTREEARKRCSASVVVQPSGGSNPAVVGAPVAMAEECPPATLDIPTNIENRQKCIDQANYGPLDPNLPNEDYWKKKADQFNTTPDEAKKALCGNCSFFIQTKEILDCIAQGLGDVGNDPYDSIKAGDLGYCEAYDFKCASSRTCDAWVVGGPITQ